MELVDTHCHIQSAGNLAGEQSTGEKWAKVPELTGDKIVENARAVGVAKLICVGCDLNDSQLAIDFASSRGNCWASIGIHPHEAQHYVGNTEKLTQFANLASKPKVVAIGECGLDYFYEYSPREAQLKILKFQIELALEHDLPMIFHVRLYF
jgi:TatD DNase family protein